MRLKNSRKLRFRKKSKKGLYSLYIICAVIAVIALFVMIGTNDELQESNDGSDTVVSEGALEPSAENEEISDSPENADEAQVVSSEELAEIKLSQMSIEEKAAQIFMITPEALTGKGTVIAAGDTTKSALEQYPVGGIIYFANNIVNPDQFKEMTENTQSYAKDISGVPIFLGIDEEGGSVSRIANKSNFNVKTFENMSSIGASGDTSKAYEVGTTIGAYLKEYGINLDFAPIADVLTNSENTVVKDRSFGTDPDLVAAMDLEVMRGLSENGIYSCFKHFPGHGGTSGDTHNGYDYTSRTIDQIYETELVPFKKGIENDVPFIMVSHIAAPNITGNDEPASLSSVMVTDVLRNHFGYDGIVITDAMNMGAITEFYTSEQAAVKAIQAGVDMILMPKDFKSAYNGVLSAVKSGEISEERLNQSVKRILKAKYALEQ